MPGGGQDYNQKPLMPGGQDFSRENIQATRRKEKLANDLLRM